MKKAILLAFLGLAACAPVDCGLPPGKSVAQTAKEGAPAIEAPVSGLPEQTPVMPTPKKKK